MISNKQNQIQDKYIATVIIMIAIEKNSTELPVH